MGAVVNHFMQRVINKIVPYRKCSFAFRGLFFSLKNPFFDDKYLCIVLTSSIVHNMHHHVHITVPSLGDLPGRDEIFVFKDIFIENDIEKISPTSKNQFHLFSYQTNMYS